MGKVYELGASERRAGVIDDRMCRGGRSLRASFLLVGAKKSQQGRILPLALCSRSCKSFFGAGFSQEQWPSTQREEGYKEKELASVGGESEKKILTTRQ